MSFEVSAILLTWVAIALLSLAVAGLLRQVRLLSNQPRVGSVQMVSTERGPLAGHDLGSLQQLRSEAGKPSVVLFASGDCQVCSDRFSDLEQVAGREDNIDFRLVVPHQANGFKSSEIVVLENEQELFSRLEIPVTPFGLALGAEGRIVAAGPVGSSAAIGHLVSAVGEKE
jgi:hypothetical protein